MTAAQTTRGDYGVDVALIFRDGVADIDPMMTLVSGPIVVAQSLYIACMASPGTIVGAPDGAGVADALNSHVSPEQLRRNIIKTAMLDDRVRSASCEVTENGDGYKFYLTAYLVDGARVTVSNEGVGS
jgi:hypothetical protein